MSPRARVAVVGSINLDTVLAVPRFPHPGETVNSTGHQIVTGGKGANQAISSARIAETALVANVGDDEAGHRLRTRLGETSVDASFVETAPGPSGMAYIWVTPDGENAISLVLGANTTLTAGRVTAALQEIRPAVVLAQWEIPEEAILAAAEWAEENGSRFVFNLSPVPEATAPFLALCDPLIVNAGEARAILDVTKPDGTTPDEPMPEEPKADHTEAVTTEPGTEAGDTGGDSDRAAIEELATRLAASARSAIVTGGRHGSAISEDGRTTFIPAESVTAVDTTGAGDAFAGVLAARLALGDDLAAAARAASSEAARLVGLPREAR